VTHTVTLRGGWGATEGPLLILDITVMNEWLFSKSTKLWQCMYLQPGTAWCTLKMKHVQKRRISCKEMNEHLIKMFI